MKKFHHTCLTLIALAFLIGLSSCKKEAKTILTKSYLQGAWTVEIQSKVKESGITVTVRGTGKATFNADGTLTDAGQLSIRSGKTQIAQMKYKEVYQWSIKDDTLVLKLKEFTSFDHKSSILSEKELAKLNDDITTDIDKSDIFKVTSIKPNVIKLESTDDGILVTAIYTREIK